MVGLNESRSCKVVQYEYVGEPWNARLCYRPQEYLEVHVHLLHFCILKVESEISSRILDVVPKIPLLFATYLLQD